MTDLMILGFGGTCGTSMSLFNWIILGVLAVQTVLLAALLIKMND